MKSMKLWSAFAVSVLIGAGTPILVVLGVESIKAHAGDQENPIAPFEINCNTHDVFGYGSGADAGPVIEALIAKGFAPGKKYKLTGEHGGWMYDFIQSAEYPRVSPYVNTDVNTKLLGYGFSLLGDFDKIVAPTVKQLNARLDGCQDVSIHQGMSGPSSLVTLWDFKSGMQVSEIISLDKSVTVHVSLPDNPDTVTYAH